MATQPNPKDSMKSTWRRADRDQWTIFHWLPEILGIYPISLNKEVPVHSKEDKVPFMSNWQQQRWVFLHACIPLVIHQAYTSYTGKNFGAIAASVFYSFAFKLIAIHELHLMRRLGHIYGFLDGDKHERDDIPDVSVRKVIFSLISTSTFRPMMVVFLSYHTNKTPMSINWQWLPLEIGLYGIAIDLWFYLYHRLMHDVGSLWQYHRTHHLTKHPTPLLTLYADTEQEFFDIIGVPLMAYFTLKLLGLPMGFYECWICHQYVVFTELFGHSGIRIHASPPSTLNWLLTLCGAELVIEDHDLHHRKGWKKSHNYGKQTRIFDRLFGTCHDRIECSHENIDFDNRVSLPLF